MDSKLIFQKIPAIMSAIRPLTKDKRSTQGYDYRSVESIYNEISHVLSEHKVFTTSEILSERTEIRESKTGGSNIYRIIQIKYSFFAEDGSFVQVTTQGEAMDSGDKASTKAQTIAHRIALTQVFMFQTSSQSDDKGANQPKQQSSSTQPATASQADEAKRTQILKVLQELSSDPKKQGDYLEECTKYNNSPGKRSVKEISPVSLSYVLSSLQKTLTASKSK